MKKTQMIHSPRTFKFGLGLMLAASMASMPVLTGASERQEAKAAAASKKLTEAEARDSEKRSKQKSSQQEATASREAKNPNPKAEGGTSKTRTRDKSAEGRARERTAKLELEAKKIADQLTPSQRTKLLALINDSKSGELAAIRGVGKSRSAAIEKARPIESIEDLPKVRGVGLKTLADVVDHGRGMAEPTKAKSKRATSKSDTAEDPAEGSTTDPEVSASEA